MGSKFLHRILVVQCQLPFVRVWIGGTPIRQSGHIFTLLLRGMHAQRNGLLNRLEGGFGMHIFIEVHIQMESVG